MEEKKKSRGWVKDAAIVFLVVLLVLTFFSNTILNRSLPEVATVYVQEGTITNKVRGTGTVTARENYDVTIEQTRKVQSVLVRVGDEVQAGDVLFTLQPGDSDELEQAEKQLKSLEKQLRSLENEYQLWLLGLTDADEYKLDQAVSDARESLQDARLAQEEAAITEEDRAEYEADLAELEAELAELEKKVDEQQTVVDARTEDVDAVEDGSLRELELQRRELQDEKEAKELVVRAKQAVVSEKQAVVTEKQAAVDAAQEKVTEAEKIRNQFSSQDPSYAPVSSAWDQVKAAQSAYDAAANELAVQKLLYEEEYADLVKTATQMEYDHAVYMIRGDTEVRYRAEHDLGSADLTEAQAAEVKAMAQPEIDALGDPNLYTAKDLRIYMAAVAAMNPDSGMAAAYEKICAAQDAADSAEDSLSKRQAEYSRAYDEYYSKVAEDSAYYRYNRDVINAQDAVTEAKKPLTAAQKELTAAEDAVKEAQAEVAKVQQALDDLNARVSRINSEELKDRSDALKDAQDRLTELRTEQEKTEQEIQKLKNDMKDREAAYKTASQTVRNQERALDDAIRSLESGKKSDSVQQMRNTIERQDKLDAIEEQKAAIEEQRAKVEELTGTDNGTEVKSNVAGKVQSLSVSAGHKAEAGSVLAVIEVPDLGYSMTFTVTNEQARRLRIGDSATVSNYYWGSQIVATLSSIQTDPQNPQGSKLLTFDVTGDVTVGNSLTISVGERNANYDMVVPNSAVRSDTNGSFVLMITAKNSPLGNRYFATRVNVEVIASDDQYSAISGAIEAYDSVITTASRNAPISSGDQVRLADANN